MMTCAKLMSMSNPTPRDIDTALAAKHHELDAAEQKVAYNDSHLLSLAKAKYYYRGRQRVTDMSVEEAQEVINEALVAADAHIAANSVPSEYGGLSTDWTSFKSILPPYEVKQAQEQIAKRPSLIEKCTEIMDEIRELEAQYTGWSRFFLVTSSTGHVHSSTHCSTCRPTTAFGWLPELSGKTEKVAVKELGPNLCSICFASAPVAHIGGKITKAQAAKLAA